MKKHLNTLFVTTQGAYLAKEGETVAVKVEGKVRMQLPIHTLGGIVCFGQVSCSPYLMGFCAKNDVAISFLTEYGRFLARVQGPVSGNVLLRREQYRWADDQNNSTSMARFVVIGKICNSRTVLQRALRDHSSKVDVPVLQGAIDRLNSILMHIRADITLNTIRGYEGEAAQVYFNVFDSFLWALPIFYVFALVDSDSILMLGNDVYTVVLLAGVAVIARILPITTEDFVAKPFKPQTIEFFVGQTVIEGWLYCRLDRKRVKKLFALIF